MGMIRAMTDLPVPTPYHFIEADDLRVALSGTPDGWYRSSDLLPRYNAWADQAGKPQATSKQVGQAIARWLRPQRRTRQGSSLWWIDAKALRGEGRVEIWESPLKDVDIASLPRYPGT